MLQYKNPFSKISQNDQPPLTAILMQLPPVSCFHALLPLLNTEQQMYYWVRTFE